MIYCWGCSPPCYMYIARVVQLPAIYCYGCSTPCFMLLGLFNSLLYIARIVQLPAIYYDVLLGLFNSLLTAMADDSSDDETPGPSSRSVSYIVRLSFISSNIFRPKYFSSKLHIFHPLTFLLSYTSSK